MTRAQQRAVALSAARYQLRQLKVNPLEASAADAHAALDDYAPSSDENNVKGYIVAVEHAMTMWRSDQVQV